MKSVVRPAPQDPFRRRTEERDSDRSKGPARGTASDQVAGDQDFEIETFHGDALDGIQMVSQQVAMLVDMSVRRV